MKADISYVRRNILILITVVVSALPLVLFLTAPTVTNLSPTATRVELMNYVVAVPLLLIVLNILFYRYLRPISQLAEILENDAPIPTPLAQKARTQAFTLPVRFLQIPVLSVFIVATLADILNLVFSENYSLAQHYPMTILAIIAAACGSLILSVISRRILTPVLLVTANQADDIGPRLNIRTRQFATTLLLTLIAVAFLGVLGYNQVVQSQREGLREKYILLGEYVAQDLATQTDNEELLTYVEGLFQDEDGYAFVIDAMGFILSQIPEGHDDLQVGPGVLAQQNREWVDTPNGEVILIPLDRPDKTWLLGIAYPVDPLKMPLVRHTLTVLAVFMAGMFTFVFVTSYYVSEDLTHDIRYVTDRLVDLAHSQEVDFDTVNVLSLDEVGDLVAAFNALQGRIQAQASELSHLADDLAEEKSKLDAILQNIADGLIVTDPQNNILLVNPAFENILGQPAAAVIGHPLTDVAVGQDLQHLISSALTEQYRTFTSDIPLPDSRMLRASAAAIQQGDQILGVVTILRDITARKRAELGRERAIREKDTLLSEFRAVLEAIDYGVLLMDSDLRTRAANRAFKEMWHLSEDQIASQPTMTELINYNRETGLYDIPPEAWEAYVEGRVSEVREGRVPPTSLHRRDGHILRYQAMLLPGGGRMLTYFDITDLVRQTEYMAALNDMTLGLVSRLDLSDLLETILSRAGQLLGTDHGYIYLVDPDEERLERRVGVGIFQPTIGARLRLGEGLAGKIWQTGQPLAIDDYDAWSGRSANFEYGIIHAVMGVPLKSGSEVIGVIGLAYDVASNRTFGSEEVDLLNRFAKLASIALDNAQLYEEAQREKQYFESLVFNSPVAVVVIDLEGIVTAWNPAAKELFGYARVEAIGQNVDDLVAPEETREKAVAYTQQSATGEMVHAITRRRRQDGSLVDVELLAVPVIVDQEQEGTLVMYHDITELQRARQEAEAANQAKSAFLATMSHEIRTPMNAVIGMTSLLLDTGLSAEQQEFVETIRTSGDALLTIINDILDFSKIEAGKMELESQPLDVRECVEEALDLVASRASEKGLDLGYLVGQDVPAAIYGDATRLRQVLVNLLSNGVKFTEHGEVVVQVDGKAVGPGEYELHFAVRDTGIGIPPERMDRLFRSFSQVDASTTRRYGGTGLGLAISKRLCELMGGRMWVESAVDQGSTFHFLIRGPKGPAIERQYRRREQPNLRGKRVLIVDDNATNRRILELETASWGMEPRLTGQPQEGLGWVRRGDAFDVAILDMQMPDMDGVTLARELQALRGPGLHLVMLTSLGQPEVQVEGVEFAAFLTKPIKPSQLYNVLVEVLAGEQEEPTKQRAAVSAFDGEMGQRLPLRILLAEDNAINQKLALRLLERMGYRADVAGNGMETLEALRRQRYDVVLMDVQMPEMDGLETTRHIRSEWAVQDQPRIIAMTANAMQEDREQCLAAGMDDYLSKPIRVDALIGALEQCQPLSDSDEWTPGDTS